MKLLHVVPSYLPAWRHGGPIRSVHGLCEALVAAGHQVTVFTTDTDVGDEVPRAQAVDRDGVAVWYFPVAAPRRLYRSPAMVRIDKLKAKADEAEAEARIAYLLEIKALRSKQEAAKLRLREVSEAGEGAYKELRAGAEEAVEELERAVHAAAARFH